jgi:hypothetical protein
MGSNLTLEVGNGCSKALCAGLKRAQEDAEHSMKKAANDRNSLNATLFIDKDGVTLRRSAGRQLGDNAFCTNSLILMTNLIKQGHGKTVCGGRKNTYTSLYGRKQAL